MGFWNQLRLLLWKNFTIRRRQPVRVVVEIMWPLCLFLILVAVRMRPDLKQNKPECHYDGKAMPSSGTLSFLQSYMCTLSNNCNQRVTEGELPGTVPTFNSSLISLVFGDLEKLLGSSTQREEISRFVEDLQTLQQLTAVIANGSSVGGVNISGLFVNPEAIRQQVLSQNISLTPEALDTLFNASVAVNRIIFSGDVANATSLVMELINSTQAGMTLTNQTLDDVRSMVCDGDLLFQYLNFPDPAQASSLQAQLCNLSAEQGVELFNDFRDQFSVVNTIDEVRKFVFSNTGNTPNVDLQLLNTLQRLAADFRELQSVQLLGGDLSEELQAIRDYLTNATGQRNATNDLGRFFCGRDRAIFNMGGGGGSQKSAQTGQGQTPTGAPSPSNQTIIPVLAGSCETIFSALNRSSMISALWKQIQPIVQGIIPYAPDTPATRKIIKQANRTFESLGAVIDLADQWLTTLSPDFKSFLETGPAVQFLRNFASGGTCQLMISIINASRQNAVLWNLLGFPAIPNLPPLNVTYCRLLAAFLSNDNAAGFNWKTVLNTLNSGAAVTRNLSRCFNLDKFTPYESEKDFVDNSFDLINNSSLWAAVIFEDMEEEGEEVPAFIKYKIRMNPDYLDSTKKIRDKYWRPRPRGRPVIDTKYTTFGFAYIQDMIDHAIIRLHGNVSQEEGVVVQQFPYPCWIYDRFVFAISRSLPLFMVISWIYSVAMIVKGIVHEKEMRLKEVMKIMGLGNGVHWLAWFINAFVLMVITIVLFCIILKAGKVLEHSDPTVIFVFMLAFTMATIAQCFLISVFFSRANLAAVCGGFIYFVLYLPYTQLVVFEEYTTTTLKLLSCLSSNIAFGFGCAYIARYEEQAVGSQWSNIGESPVPIDTFNLQWCIFMMLTDTAIYLLLTWYIEAVFPGQYGMPRKWYFPIQRSYWLGHRNKGGADARRNEECNLGDIYRNNDSMEKEPTGHRVGVGVRNLRKVYSTGKKVAVDGLTINFYEDQITSFLGHNGAGKTTTMSILTGLFPPTSGTAYIYGKDIQTCTDEIRQSLGMCPQHNVLFDLLTVEEHIWFYARLKGLPESEVQKEIRQMIKDVGLPHKRNEQSRNLSGGMKRKLSVAIAFVGGSRTVILDEPTAGVDPYARRSIWELLLKLRKGRTVILSTHHMDEADVLGDRIAIISHGALCALGSSLFLKNRFGSGYYLTLVRSEENAATGLAGMVNGVEMGRRKEGVSDVRNGHVGAGRDAVESVPPLVDEGYEDCSTQGSEEGEITAIPDTDSMVPGFSLFRLKAFVRKFVAEAQLVEDNSMEVCFQLPEASADSGQMTALFAELEKVHLALGIASYGISDTSLEEVFLKVTEENDPSYDDEVKRQKLEDISEHGRYPRPISRLSFRDKNRRGLLGRSDTDNLLDDQDDNVSVESSELGKEDDLNFSGAGKVQLTGRQLIPRQIISLLLKRFHHVRRSKKGFISEFILPAAFICLAMVFSLIQPPLVNMPPLELHPWHYQPSKGDSQLFSFYSNDNRDRGRSTLLEETLLKSGTYHGARCMDPSVYTISGYPCLGEGSSSFTAQPHTTGNITIDSPDCSCDTGFQQCPAGAGGPTPAERYIPVNDILYNMTGRNISDWLIKTTDRYMMRRFGGFSFGEERWSSRMNASQLSQAVNDLTSAFNNGTSVIPTQFTADLENFLQFAVTQDNARVWFNNKGWISIVAYMNSLNNIILRSYMPPANRSQYGIVTVNHPVNFTERQLDEETVMNNAVDVLVAICVIFAMSFVPASFVLFLIEERVSNSKHLQFVSGINPAFYWVTNFIWDVINYSIPAVLCILIFVAFGEDAYVSSTNAPCLVALLFLYGWAITPMMYPFSRLFSVPSSAFVALSCVNTFLGTVSTISTFILELLQQDDEELRDINTILKQVFLLLPHYCLGRGLIDMAALQLRADIQNRYATVPFEYNLFAWNTVGRNLFSLFMLGLFFFLLNILMEYNFFIQWRCIKTRAKFRSQDEEDEDVAKERQRVLSGGAQSDIMRLENLTKVYWAPGRKSRLAAVDHLCVGVPAGQCFGLLGVNGAGKTTTFKMLTGDVDVSRGNAFINGYGVRSDMVKVCQYMGYCPQFDALDPLLTGREHLEFYARIRGIPWRDVKSVANWAVEKLGLTMYADKVSSSYSGGNKRKLSTAIALIGNPPIIFLDEPTTGMDPKARRFLWNCINNIVKSGRSVILTSHSMEECEALCGRLAIMVNGTFKCLGSIQHLKNRFGDGYTVILRVGGEEPAMEGVKQFVRSHLQQSELREEHHNMLQYQLPSHGLSLAHVFGVMEQAKREFCVEDYSVSQTTLDQVFINFAKLQTDLLDDEVEEGQDGHASRDTAGTYCLTRTDIADEENITGSQSHLIGCNNGQRNSQHAGKGHDNRVSAASFDNIHPEFRGPGMSIGGGGGGSRAEFELENTSVA